MRPVRLVLEGFGAFKERTDIDFDDTDFFALVGATGSGKSTVVDALCFALYGSVPRYGDERLVGSAMSVGHQETRVHLTFEVGGRRYQAARVVRRDRNGRATTKEARLETAAGRVLAGRATDMAPAVEALLGLPFTHFTRCVVLPQGEFARFLHDRPADRQELLVSLLDLGVYERVAQEANRRAGALEAMVRLAEQQLAGLAEATPAAVDEARQRWQLLTVLAERLELAAPQLAEAEAQLADALAEVERCSLLLAALNAVEVPEAARSMGAQLAAANLALDVARSELARAAEAAEHAAQSVTKLAPADNLRVVLAAHDELAGCRRQLHETEQRQAAAVDALDVATAAERRASDVASEAEAEHEHARQEFAAHLLAEQLEVGGICPVCGQEVLAQPSVAAPEHLGERRERATAARLDLDQQRERHRKAEVAAERARGAVDDLVVRVRGLEGRVGAHPDRALLEARIAEVASVHELEREARRCHHQRADEVESHRGDVADRRAALGGLAAQYHGQRDQLVALSPPPPGDDLVAGWYQLQRWAAQQRAAQATAHGEAQAAAADAARRREALLAGLVSQAAAAGVVAPADTAALHRAAVQAQAAAAERLAALEREVETVARLAAERERALEQRAVAAELGRLLSARGFERWLVAEALHRLAVGASITLRRLSGGQFSLLIDATGEFSVTDHGNGDEVRPVRTLSGGETFQASLALALALADELSGLAGGGASKLDAIFLDEGFGTLDPDSLETVAATIESLGAGGRMVGIVTHVRELAARVPVRYEVRKGPATSTVERVVS